MPRSALPAILATTLALLSPIPTMANTSEVGSQPANLTSPLSPHRGDLDDLRWEKRPVLVFATSPDDPAFLRQMTLFRTAAEGLADRDILVLHDTAPATSGALRQSLSPKGFTVMLVGKDGGVKLRQHHPLTADALFATIDRMPMRRAEVTR